MARRLIVDTNVLIDVERGALGDELDHDDLAIASVTVAEFHVGVELAASADVAARRARSLEAILANVVVLDYTVGTALVHAKLMAEVRRAGRPRGAHDLIIAAHAIETGRLVATRDAAARFGDLSLVETVAVHPDA